MCRTPIYIIDLVTFWPPSPVGPQKKLELNVHFFWLNKPQSVNGITGRHLFRTWRNAIMAIQCLELLYVALFACILGKNVLYYWFGGVKSNHLCLCQDTEIPTGCWGDKYGIAFDRDFRPVRNSSLLLHCYWLRWTIQLLEEVQPVGFRMATSNSVNRLWNCLIKKMLNISKKKKEKTISFYLFTWV